MPVISLTSIPPRFGQLGACLEGLLAQRPEALILAIPRRYRRFPGPVEVPPLPAGVTLLRPAQDAGPALKLLAAARYLRGQGVRLIYCDDDWDYAPGWAAALEAAWTPGRVASAAPFAVRRLRRAAPYAPEGSPHAPPGAWIAQGFAGVLLAPDELPAGALAMPPAAAWAVDDIWLSAQFARAGLGITTVPAARALAVPRAVPGPQLQDARIEGQDRAAANRACAALAHARYGLWPPLPGPAA